MEAKLRTYEQKTSIFSNSKIAAAALAGSVLFSGCASESETPTQPEVATTIPAGDQAIDTSDFLYSVSCSGVDEYYKVDSVTLPNLNNFSAVLSENSEINTLSESMSAQVKEHITLGDEDAYFELNEVQEASVDYSTEQTVKERFGSDPALDEGSYDVSYVIYTENIGAEDFISKETGEVKDGRPVWRSDEVNFCVSDVDLSQGK